MTSEEKNEKICKFALEMLFNTEREFVKKHGGIYIYKNNDGEMDSCMIRGSRIFWRVEKSNHLNGHGRWRDHELDEKISCKLNGNSVEITVIDGKSSERKVFKL